jgi:hypothetical protein
MPEQQPKITTLRPASAAEQPATTERRRSPRHPFTAMAEAVELQSMARITGRTSDISRGGCYVDTMSPFPVGAALKLRLTYANRSFQCQAVVVYAHVGMGMGLAFTQAAADQVRILQEWIAEVSGQPLPPPPEPSPVPQAVPSAVAPLASETEEPEEKNERFVLNQLVNLLMRKKILTEKEATALLRELFR